MKHAALFAFALFYVLAGQSAGYWWWPPTGGGAAIEPDNPTTSDVVSITLYGEWPNSCVPNGSAISVEGRDVYFTVIHDYPPGGCLAVITGWGETQLAGPLSPGTYTVHGRLVGDPFVLEEYTPVAEFTVTDYQFVLSAESLSVPEGADATFTVRLLKDPHETVNVTIAHKSGDPDVSVQSGASLTFDPYNYSVSQTVTLAAAEDVDYLNGIAIISVTSPDYLATELVVTELDKHLPSILYVDIDANGNNDGRSWSNAFTRLQDALRLAAEYGGIQEVRVAQGTYRPAVSGGDKDASFQVADLIFKGGYAGTGEPDPDAHDIEQYPTVLSGDLNGDDGPDFTNTGDNSEHVVKTDGEVEVDGFTISSGYGGAGMLNGQSSSVTVRNCTFKANHAMYGAAVYNHFDCDVEFVNCVFIGNLATHDGGAIHSSESDLELRRCVFSANQSRDGGAIYTGHYTDIILMNCTFTQNQASDEGGAMRIEGLTDALLTSCIFWDNTDSSGTNWSAQVHGGTAEHLIINCSCVQGGMPSSYGIGNIASDPCFVDPDNGGYHLQSQAGRFDPNEGRWITDNVTSPCIDAGDPTSPIGFEPFPNGGIINMGAYGGSGEASKSYFGKSPCEIIVAGDVNGDCVVDFLDFRLIGLHWCEDNNP